MKYQSKPGKHGTLFLFRIAYTDAGDGGCPTFTQNLWAYDREHAEMRFAESDDDSGWKIETIERVRAA